MKRWNTTKDDLENKRVDAFLEALCAACKLHGLSISHQDNHGAFVIEELDEANLKWLNDAEDGTISTQNVRKE